MRRIAILILCLGLFAPAARAQPAAPALRTLNVITFQGGFNLPMYVAERQRFFARHGLEVKLHYTPNSVYLMTGLIEGRFDIATASIDNLIAYQEGQGEAPLKTAPDLAAFMGLENGLLNLISLPDIRSIGDLRGKDVAVDALTTGFAFVLREMVARAGVPESEVKLVRAGATSLRYAGLLERKFAATLLTTPFDLQAADKGYRRLGSATDLLGAYQGRAAFATRGWLKDNQAATLAFMRATREATEWIYDPKNREICEALLIAFDRDMTPPLARKTYEVFTDSKNGLYRDVKIDLEGLKLVLALRSKYGLPKKELNDPMKYIDIELYRKAFP
jgi:ABC-type nitrate/sulfonate/bicarbonate transport system substrate-binding protein